MTETSPPLRRRTTYRADDALSEVTMSSFISAQVSTTTGRRTIQLQPLAEPKRAGVALLGAGLTVAAVVVSMLAFAAI